MVSIIVAIARNRVIGCENKLIWHISEDLKHFKAVTTGHPVIMGRKTFESIGKPLPGRINVIITRNSSYAPEGCRTASSLDEALGMFPAEEEVFIIGGGEIYGQALPTANKLYITEIDADFDGDTLFPEWNKKEWKEISREKFDRGQNFEHPFSFIEYVKT